MASWLSDASANRHIKTYVKDFLDLSGNLTVRSNEDYDWNAYGQVLSGNYESDTVSFGISTDMDASGTTIVVGANKDNTAGTAGAAYVYKYDSDAEIWYQHGPSLTPNTSVDSRFGWQAAFISDDGSIVAVHDHLSSSTTSSNTAVGKTYVFQYNSSTNAWDDYGLNQSVLEGTSTNEQLGHTGLSMSGDGSTIAAAEELNDHEIRIFKLVSGSWTQIGTFSTSSVNYARPSLNYDGSRVVFNDYTNQQALVYDYSGSGTSWNQVGSAITNTGANGTDSHTSINKEGNIVAIHEQTNQTVRIYQYDTNVTGSWKQLGTTLMNSYGSSGAFGKMRLNTAGDMIIVGDSGNSTLDIFKYQNDDWVIIGDTITGIAGSQYGRAVAISDDGSKIVVGGYAADLNTTNSGYVQAWQWSQKTYTNPMLDISGGTMAVWGSAEDTVANYSVTNVTTFEDGTDNYGANMKFNADGTIMVVGEWGYNSNAGRIHAYKYRSGTWSKMGSDAVDSNIIEIGFSLGINDSGFIIGSGGGGTSGGVIIWEFINGDWSVKGGEISNSNFSYFGHRGVSFNGEGNIVACKGNEGAAVYQYNSVNDNWDQLGSDITGITTNGGKDEISLNQAGNIVAITDPGYDSPATDAGRVGIFQYNSGSWDQLGDWITAPSTSGGTGDHYGTTVSLSSDGYIVAFGTAIGSGATTDYHARIFQYVPSVEQWTPRSPDVQNDDVATVAGSGNKVGSNVALSGDGNTLVVNDNDAQTASGVYGGAVHVLKYINGVYKWVTRLDGPTDTNANLNGDSVAISRDGTRFGGSRGSNDYVRIGTIVNSPPLKIEDGNTIMNGNVGIGTTSPEYNLDIYGGSSGATGFEYTAARFHSEAISGTGNISRTYLTLDRGNWGGAIGGYLNQGTGSALLLGTVSNGTISDRMTILNSGNIGIGTDNPNNKLHIYATDNTSNIRINNATSTTGFILEQSTNKYTYIRNTETTGGIIFHAGNTQRMSINGDGKITMTSGLKVQGTYYSFDYNNSYNYWTKGSGGFAYDPGNRNFGVEVDNYLEAQGVLVTSDERIKTNIKDIEDDKALQELRLLCPKTYSYKDTFIRGDTETIGFIAQEVQKVLPRAVTTGTKSIPNILKPAIAHYKENNIFDLSFSVPIDSDITLTSDSTIELNVNGNTIEAKVVSYTNDIIEITTENTDQIKDGDKVVIYGEIVDDFHFLDKNAIFTVATAALQEVDRQLQAEKAKVATLESQLTDVLSRLAALESA
jgi:hypothetical protein